MVGKKFPVSKARQQQQRSPSSLCSLCFFCTIEKELTYGSVKSQIC